MNNYAENRIKTRRQRTNFEILRGKTVEKCGYSAAKGGAFRLNAQKIANICFFQILLPFLPIAGIEFGKVRIISIESTKFSTQMAKTPALSGAKEGGDPLDFRKLFSESLHKFSVIPVQSNQKNRFHLG